MDQSIKPNYDFFLSETNTFQHDATSGRFFVTVESIDFIKEGILNLRAFMHLLARFGKNGWTAPWMSETRSQWRMLITSALKWTL